MRRHDVRVAVASARPTALDPRADAVLRTAPNGAAALLVALDAALADDVGDLGGAASAAGSSADAVSAFAEALTAAGEDVVIVYGERLLSGPGGDVAARALLNLASRLGLAGRAGAGLLEIPASTNGRGLREAGFAAGHGPATRRWPSRAAARPRSPAASPTATCTRSTCCTPTRCARIPTARCGSRRCIPRRP